MEVGDLLRWKENADKAIINQFYYHGDGKSGRTSGRHISRQEAMLLGLFSKAVRGDVKATNAILAMCMKFEPPQEIQDEPKNVSESDQAIIEDFLRRRAGAHSVSAVGAWLGVLLRQSCLTM